MPCNKIKVQQGYVDLTGERKTKKVLLKKKRKTIKQMKKVMPLP